MGMVKNDGHGVYQVQRSGTWWYRTYKSDDLAKGPFDTREIAMEKLLETLGFDVAPSLSVNDQIIITEKEKKS